MALLKQVHPPMDVSQMLEQHQKNSRLVQFGHQHNSTGRDQNRREIGITYKGHGQDEEASMYCIPYSNFHSEGGFALEGCLIWLCSCTMGPLNLRDHHLQSGGGCRKNNTSTGKDSKGAPFLICTEVPYGPAIGLLWYHPIPFCNSDRQTSHNL